MRTRSPDLIDGRPVVAARLIVTVRAAGSRGSVVPGAKAGPFFLEVFGGGYVTLRRRTD